MKEDDIDLDRGRVRNEFIEIWFFFLLTSPVIVDGAILLLMALSG